MNELEEKIRSINLRRAWAQKKFGQCSGKPEGCEQGITQEDLRSLQVVWYIPGLGRTTSLDIFCKSPTKKKQEAKQTPQRKAHIKCRHCCGCHLTAKCPNRSGAVPPAAVAPVQVERVPQTYYLGPPPGIESNPLDFELSDTEQQQKTEEKSATVQSYVQMKQVEEDLHNQIMNVKHKHYSHRGSRPAQAPTARSPPKVTRKMNSLKRRVKNDAATSWDVRKRKIPPPGSSDVKA